MYDPDIKLPKHTISIKCDMTVPYSVLYGTKEVNKIANNRLDYLNHITCMFHKIDKYTYELLGLWKTLDILDNDLFSYTKSRKVELREGKRALYFYKTTVDYQQGIYTAGLSKLPRFGEVR
jgi:hypothetical protein